METCDEPHPENTSVHTVGAESNKTNAHAATWQTGAHSHILHNPVQVCELLPTALLPLQDTVKELHKHVEGAAGYSFTCFGKLDSAMSWAKALPHSPSRELQLAQAVPGLRNAMPARRLVSQRRSASRSSPLPLLGSCKATLCGRKSREGGREPPARNGSGGARRFPCLCGAWLLSRPRQTLRRAGTF